MRRAEYPPEIQHLTAQLKRLPGVGPRSAERLALHLLTGKSEVALELAKSVELAVTRVSACARCGFYQSIEAECALCDAVGRDQQVICVVEQPADVLPLERTGAFSGLYHVLGGRISPLNGVHPEHLRIDSLVHRVESCEITEVILALGADVEGEATSHYVADALSRSQVPVTRLAQGLPAGGGLEQADELTLFRALNGRRPLE
jgi:recombination protein RecR